MIRDITEKNTSLRTAKAIAVLYCSEEIVKMAVEKKIPKGDIFEFARAAGYYAAKNTSNLIPHCHPVAIHSLSFEFEPLTDDIISSHGLKKASGFLITGLAKCIDRTGIEMEILTGVSLCALTMYDILKPLDATLEITSIKLLEKTGGKSDRRYFNTPPSCAVLICSTDIHAGKKEDRAGKQALTIFKSYGIENVDYQLLPNNFEAIKESLQQLIEKNTAYIFTIGGTGLGAGEYAVEAVESIIERPAEGLADAIRSHGLERSRMAMMSRLVAGTVGVTTIVTLPGSSSGVADALHALLPAVFHVQKMLQGGGR
jgi:cyclic pyranopterin monophosphate synthase